MARASVHLRLLALLAVLSAADAPAQQPQPRPGGKPAAPQTAPKPPEAPPAGPEARPAPVPAAAGELQPVLHARSAGIVTCLDGVARAAAGTIEAPHAAMSSWLTDAANQGPFSSIIAMKPDNRAAPNAAAFIHMSPTPNGGCQGSTVQVVPTARSCGAMQAEFSKGGRTVANPASIPIVQRDSGERYMLLQAPGGCVIVSVNLLATAPAPTTARAPVPAGPTRPASPPARAAGQP